eukprot:4052468-Pyramimonas_sp.AAC.1
MVDNAGAGMRKNRIHIKKCKYASETHDAYFIRPSNGRSSPGIKCPESLYMRIADLTIPGVPGYTIHGTAWENIPSILRTGLSCWSNYS